MAVFLALGFAFYVFFAPFLGRKLFQYIAIGLYTPLVSPFHVTYLFVHIFVFTCLLWLFGGETAEICVFSACWFLEPATIADKGK